MTSGLAVQGIVEIPLAAAAAADSEGFALRPELGPECEAAQGRRRAVYGHVFGVLRALTTGSGNPGAQAAIAAGVLGLRNNVACCSPSASHQRAGQAVEHGACKQERLLYMWLQV
jgi:hypothetical protein